MKLLSLFAAAAMLFGVQSANAVHPPVETPISFTLSEAGVGTLILPYDAALPDGLKAYKCVSLQETKVMLEEQKSIAAHTPVLMQGEPGTYIFTGTPLDGDASYTSGLLTGVMETTVMTTGYVLATQDGMTGFYQVESGTTLPANRCYLQVEAPVKMLELLFPEEHAATFTASKIEITSGQTAQLVIGMNNTEANLSGFQFKLYLPEGLSVTINDDGQFVYTRSGRIANHTVNVRNLDDGGYLFVVYSMDADVITGSSGELMSISVTADETASTSGTGTLSNIRITDVTSSTSSCNDVSIDITISPKVIDFADANVKAICVENWDTNGDGKLSYDEATAVTDLGTVFKDNRTITSFNELQYFKGLTSIGKEAFHSCHSLTSVTIPESVTSIGETAFYNCFSLTSLTIPENVTNIGDYAIEGCIALPSLTIPENVTSIGDYAFRGCSGLTSIKVEAGNTKYDSRNDCNAIIETATNTLITGCQNTVIPESVTSIGKTAFERCSGLTSVTIPNSVISIGEGAFFNCGLTSLTIPESVTSIGGYVFSWCRNLASIKVETGNAIYDSRIDCNAIIETATNTLISGCQNTVIPESVTSIGDYAFFGCDKLICLTIPNSVNNIGIWTFSDCSDLTSVTIPESVTIIDSYSFYGCSNLKYFYCNAKNVPTTKDDVFEKTPIDDATLYVPASSIDKYKTTEPWSSFGAIVTIESEDTYIDFADANVKTICIENWDTNGDGKLSEAEAAAVTDLGTVFQSNKEITSFEELQYFTGLTSIGSSAFSDCWDLTSVTIPESVTSIGRDAFFQCSGLNSITFPGSVTSIGTDAFYQCTGLTSVTIPNSVTSIGINPFSRCSALTSIKVDTRNTKYDSRNDCNAIIETSTNTLITGCQNTVIPNSVTSIGHSAFDLCTGLTSVTIPNSVTSIGDFAFSVCTGLASVTIPSSVKSIGDGAFWDCYGLKSIKVETGNRTYDSRNDCNAIIETETNTLITGCQNTVIPNSVTSIGEDAFMYCSGLTSVTIPNSVTSIGYRAFCYCIGLSSVTIPNSVTSIGDLAFSNCRGLTSVTIPESLTNIGNGTFKYCSRLTNITSYIIEPFAIADNVFEGIPYETATLFVPAGTIDAYRATDGWKNFQNIEVIPQQLTIGVVGDGTVTFSGETLTNTTATFTVSDEVQLLLTPEEDCHIERVMVNQQDCTSNVTDGVLTLNVIREDYFVLVEFQHNTVEEPDYVTYTIYIDGPGDVRVKDAILTGSEQDIQIPKGSNLVLEFLPDEGQMVGKVTWNEEPVTEQALGNTFVVRDVQENGEVSVIFMEKIETFVVDGIRYGVTDDIQHIVKVLPYDYSGHLSIPESFEYSQRTWQVQEIGNTAFANSEWLVSVKIPASIIQAGKNLFKRDTRLAAIQWDAQLPLRTEVTGELTNANMLYYVKDSSLAPRGGNVIVDGMAENISLSDGHDFYCPEAFKAKKITYNHIYKMLTRRGYRQGWETLILPFDVKTIRLSRNPDNPEIYPYESLTDDDKVERGETLPFWLYSYDDNDTFIPAASIKANTPYIISMPNDAAYLPVFRLAGNVTFSAQSEAGVDVQSTTDENLQTPGTQRIFHPSYQRKVMGNDCYLVNVNDSVNHQFAEGSKFIQALRPSRPFEAYMVSQTASTRLWYDIFEQMTTDIRDIQPKHKEGKNADVYDLSGRKVADGEHADGKLTKGIYIINGKKQIIK